ncbi:MAG: hypothetical protein LQ346_007747 [Caloplaca aetnensis]|nr:MAG: hypothetical protein LQ346_007747 [Caloplaca aetnensis]
MNAIDSISVYGYDQRMLEGHVLPNNHEAAHDPVIQTVVGETPNTAGRCLLLELPAELRSDIFRYVLPYTFYFGQTGICWRKGTTTLLAVSRSVHDEAAHIMYGQASFILDVLWDCTVFECQRFAPNGIVYRRFYAFPEKIGFKYLRLLRSIEVDVEVPDGRTQLVRQGLSSVAGLKQGVGDQIKSLCKILRNIPNLQRLCVHYYGPARNSSTEKAEASLTSQDILGPLLEAFPDVRISYDETAIKCTKGAAVIQDCHTPGFDLG